MPEKGEYTLNEDDDEDEGGGENDLEFIYEAPLSKQTDVATSSLPRISHCVVQILESPNTFSRCQCDFSVSKGYVPTHQASRKSTGLHDMVPRNRNHESTSRRTCTHVRV